MDDSYWKKKAEELPHFVPAHETQGGKNLEDLLATIPGARPPSQQPHHAPAQDNGWGRELDLTARFAGMLPKSVEELKAHQMMAHQRQQQPVESSTVPVEMVFLREGQTAYRSLQGAEYSPVPLAALVGPVAGVTGKEFRLVGLKEFYIVENQRQAVDLANIDYSKMKRLAMVEAPFLGTILVPESAVIRRGPSGRQVLKG